MISSSGYGKKVVRLYSEEHTCSGPGLGAWLDETYGFCVYSSSVIKIFWFDGDDIKGNLLAQIYDKDNLNFWHKVINFITFGYFYRTTEKIPVGGFGQHKISIMYKYSSNFNGSPILWKFEKNSSEIEGKWAECAVLPKISPAIEAKESVILDDQENTEEPRANKGITHEKRFLTWGVLVNKN